MKIKDFIKDGGKIISDSVQQTFSTFLSTEGQTVINNAFKYDYPYREMTEDTQQEVNELVTFILTKNKLIYSKINATLEATIADKKKSKETNSGTDTKENSGTQTNRTDYNKTDTVTPAETTTTNTPADYTITTTPAGTTQEVQGTVENEQVIENKPFDSTDFAEVQKVTNTDTPTNRKTVTTYQNDQEVKNVTDSPNTIKTEVDNAGTNVSSGDDTNTRTDDLKEEFTHGHIREYEELDPLTQLETLEKLRAFYETNLWNRIKDDIRHYLILDIWY